MNDALVLCSALPERRLAAGEVLIQEGVRSNALYVLQSGALDVIRDGVRVVGIDEPGAFLGEISVLLGAPPTATVVASRMTVVHVIENAATVIRTQPGLTYLVARLLARRLNAATARLVEIKREQADASARVELLEKLLADLE
ncbi:MAG TPA: cyclic nucleotide-binding domain-containing protein [Casimicrobiaceae bacterium]|nr:cyclic nucleotide-binding domain-containing protein [Casimicrobiaceae bacterium]